jgi:phosphoribosyl 1,2-cyclic phosphate phosphodiesterase
MQVTILGCGTSTGVPVVGCPCDVCQSYDPRNCRTRSSIFVSKENGNVLVDTSPDLRAQALMTGLKKISAVLYTHDHADHIFGMDELRTFNFIMGQPISVYGNEKVINRIKTVFNYIWDPNAPKGGGLPMIATNIFEGPMELAGIEVEPLDLIHGKQHILGFMFDKKVAYMTDCSAVPDETIEQTKGVDLAIIDALRYRPHITHFSIDGAVEVLEKIRPKRALLTHLSHSMDYDRLRSELPDWIEPAYDGMVIDLGDSN